MNGPFQIKQEVDEVWLSFFLDAWIHQWQRYKFFDTSGKPFKCLMGYSNSIEPNGASERIDDIHCVSLTKGMSVQYQWLAAYVLSQPSIFEELLPQPFVCEASLVDIVLQPGKFPSLPVEWINTEGLLLTPETLPARIHALLYHDLMQISLHHEIYHGLLGHLDVSVIEGQPYRLVEFAPISKGFTINEQELVALEHHADHAAVGSAVYRILIGDDSLRNTLIPEFSKAFRIGMIQIAAALICLTWSLYQEKHRQVASGHPPARVRYLGMQAAIRQIMEQNGEQKLFLEATRYSYRQLALLTKSNMFFSPLASLASPKIMQHVSTQRSKILETLTQLQEQLHSFVGEDI